MTISFKHLIKQTKETDYMLYLKEPVKFDWMLVVLILFLRIFFHTNNGSKFKVDAFISNQNLNFQAKIVIMKIK